MRVFLELTHTGCDREIMRSDLSFDVYHPPGWNEQDRPRPQNMRLVEAFSSQCSAAIVGTENGLRMVSAGVPVLWKCFTDYGAWEVPERVLAELSFWVAASKETAERWKMEGNKKARVVEHGIDSDVFFGYQGAKERVLSVGNLLPARPEKGADVLSAVGEAVPVDVVGFGNEGLRNVFVAGYCENMNHLAETYREHKVYFNPSKVVVCAVLEAMATGMPVVTMRPGNYKELMRHRENCFVADTSSDAVYYLNLLLKNREMGREIGIKARESVEHRFHPSVCATKWKGLVLEATQ